ncbi:MAG: glycyl-radical enzyme activating protein [Clostridia bacterium]|nr:glycyl-radical enzyme activating protein [Clostridia bacterium]
MTDLKAMIFDVQRNSFVDGPGIRTTVFFKGCNLRCAWCHNPEGISPAAQVMNVKGILTPCGREYTLEEIWTEIEKDRLFYETSGGGVTFSGGECMLQIDFLSQILAICKKNGIHTAVDTAGDLPFDFFARILPDVDLFLFDLKCLDAQTHKRCTGVDNARILANLALLLKKGTPLWVRIPVIPGVNDSAIEMQKIKRFLDANGKPARVDLLPYHAMGEHKYTALGLQPPPFKEPTQEQMQALKGVF